MGFLQMDRGCDKLIADMIRAAKALRRLKWQRLGERNETDGQNIRGRA